MSHLISLCCSLAAVPRGRANRAHLRREEGKKEIATCIMPLMTGILLNVSGDWLKKAGTNEIDSETPPFQTRGTPNQSIGAPRMSFETAMLTSVLPCVVEVILTEQAVVTPERGHD